MKRIGKTSNIIEEIVAESNLRNSLAVVMRGTRRKTTRTGRWIMRHQDEVVQRLAGEIRSGEFRISGYQEMIVTDGSKKRTVQAIPLIERIGINAIMSVVEAKIHNRYVRTTAASIKGRGMHFLLNKIRKDMAADPEGMKYAYKYDIRKFYENINQDFMMYSLRRMFKDRVLLTMLERFVRLMPRGLSIGLRSSQGFGNMLLSMHLGHYMKDQMGRKHAYWYCDDGDDHSPDKREAWHVRDLTHERVEAMSLQIKANERVFPITEGVDYLGYVIYPTHTRLRKRNKKNAARRLHKLKSKRRRHEIMASLYGQCKHANCRNLFYRLTNIKMSDFVRLKETGITPRYKDGKKRFRDGEMNLADLVGEEFVIVDYEEGIVTRPQRKDYEEKVARQKKEFDAFAAAGVTPPEGFLMPTDVPKPEGKHAIQIRRRPGTADEQTVKVWTGDKENWSILEQMKERDLLGKALCTVTPVRCKGFTRYVIS